MEEAREMLRDALLLMLEVNREEAEKEMEGREGVTRETLRVWDAATSFGTSRQAYGCGLKREGSRHSIYTNPSKGKGAPVPRHDEISNVTARAICDQPGIPRP